MTALGVRARRPARRWWLALALALTAGVVAAVAWAWLGRPSAPSEAAGAGASPHLAGHVVLAPAWQGRVAPDDVVIIEAHLLDGPRMAVARLERRARELPLPFELDASTATNASLRLSPSMALVVSARVARSGQAAAQPGEPVGVSPPVAVGTRDVRIEIGGTVK